MAKHSVGIDLGTTYSCVGIYKRDGIVDIVQNEHGYKTTPSYVSFTDDERYVGKTAKDKVGKNPKNTVYDVKRLIGRKFSDKEVQDELKYYSFGVTSGVKDKPMINVEYLGEEKQFHPEEISSMVLQKMKQIAENFLQDEVTDAVITVPAYFNDAQRLATKDAGTIAGINVLRTINEPTAAAIAYGLDKEGARKVLVYDLGGGTLDITVLTMEDKIFTVKSTSGITHLGGEDFDNRLREYCLVKFANKHILKPKLNDSEKDLLVIALGMEVDDVFKKMKEKDLRDKRSDNSRVNRYIEGIRELLRLQENIKLMRRLKSACEEAKKSLSTANSINVTYDNFYDGEDLDVNISRNKFERICEVEFDKCMAPVTTALDDAGYVAGQIDDVVLVGGSTRMPKIHELLDEMFPGKLRADINPDEAVAYGAAIQAAILNQETDNTIGDIVVSDVTSLSLGIKVRDGMMQTMVKRGTSLPVTETQTFSTFQDNQPMVTIDVYEGERSMVKDNNFLGKFHLKNIPPRPKGVPKIDVTFSVDVNGIMTINAEEQGSDNSNNIVIKNEKDRLSKEKIQQMLEDAQKYAEMDKYISEKMDAKAQLENYISALRRTTGESDFVTICGKDLCIELTEELDTVTDWVDDLDNEQVSKKDIESRHKLLEDRFLPIIEEYCKEKNSIKKKSDDKNKNNKDRDDGDDSD